MKEGTMVRSVAKMELGKRYFGYVCAMNASGAFVRFLGYDRLFVPRSQLATKTPEKVTDVVSEGQSVCVVRSKDVGSLRCEVEEDAQALFVASYQSERLRLLDSGNYEGEEEATVEEGEEMEEESDHGDEEESEESEKEESEKEESEESEKESDDDNDSDDNNNSNSDDEAIESDDTPSSEGMEEEDAPFDWRKCPLGSVAKGTIKSLRPYGALVELENGLLGFAQSPLHTEGVTLEEGAEVTARVLDVNPSLELFDVTLNAKFLSLPQEEVRQRSRKMSDCSFGMSVGQRVETCVLLKKEKYFVAAMPSHNNDLVFVSFDSYNSVHTALADLEPGATVSCTLVTEAGLSDLVVKETNAFKGTLEEDEEAQVRAFFGAVRGACVFNELAQHEVLTRAINQGQVIKLNQQFRGQTVNVRVRKVNAGYLNVVLLNVRCEGLYQANILNVDTDRDPLHAFEGVKEGDVMTAKSVWPAEITGRVVFLDEIREKKKKGEAAAGRMARVFLSTKQADLSLPVVGVSLPLQRRASGFLARPTRTSPSEASRNNRIMPLQSAVCRGVVDERVSLRHSGDRRDGRNLAERLRPLADGVRRERGASGHVAGDDDRERAAVPLRLRSLAPPAVHGAGAARHTSAGAGHLQAADGRLQGAAGDGASPRPPQRRSLLHGRAGALAVEGEPAEHAAGAPDHGGDGNRPGPALQARGTLRGDAARGRRGAGGPELRERRAGVRLRVVAQRARRVRAVGVGEVSETDCRTAWWRTWRWAI